MDGIVFRAATADDVPAIHRLVESAYRGDSARGGWTHEADLLGGQRTDPQAIAESIADPGQRLIVAIAADDAVIGCVTIEQKPPATAYLGQLSVLPDRQAAGLGRQLIAAAECTARELWSARRVEMTVIRQRADLIAYYQRRGYALTGEERPFPYGNARFGEPRVDDLAFVVMARDIEA